VAVSESLALPPLEGGARKADALFASLYVELRRLARREVRRNGAQHIVSTITVVHEAWIGMNARPALDFDQPGLFLGYAARAMRGLVVDRVRSMHSIKRGGGIAFTPLDAAIDGDEIPPEDRTQVESVTDALDELARLDPLLAEVVDLKFFCGFTLAEIARLQNTSERTAHRRWEKARALLYSAIAL
jgi:RNA polymerase sigma factor (TIGR02999 family)